MHRQRRGAAADLQRRQLEDLEAEAVGTECGAHRTGEQHLAGAGALAQPCRHIHRVAHHGIVPERGRTDRPGDHRPVVDADAEAGDDAVAGLPVRGEGLPVSEQRMGRSHRLAGCLLAGVRAGAGTESDHHAVTGHVAGAAAVLSDDPYEELEVTLQECHDPIGSELLRGTGEAAHIDEHHRAVDLALSHGRVRLAAAQTMRHSDLWATAVAVRGPGSR